MTLKKSSEKPQRSCIACRKTGDKGDFLRFVLSPDSIVTADLDSKLPGRGAYTCLSVKCLSEALLRKQFNRAFKQEIVTAASDDFIENIKHQMLKKVVGFIAIANKAGKIIAGGSMALDAIRSFKKSGLILIAEDASESVANKIRTVAEHNLVPCLTIMNKEMFGDILGKAPKSALCIKQSGFVASLSNEIERYRNFLGEVQNK